MRATIHNANIRGCEAKENAKGEGYLLVRFEDETGAPQSLVDKDMERQRTYRRDQDVDLLIDIDQGRKFTTIRIVGVRPLGSVES